MDTNRHHHHHHHNDETGKYRKKMEQSVRMRKLLPKILFAIGCFIAITLLIAVALLYTL